MTGDGAPCELLNWDSSWWGHTTARVTVPTLDNDTGAAVDAWCAERAVELLYFLCPTDVLGAALLAEQAGYRIMDVRVTLIYQRPPPSTPLGSREPDALLIRSAHPDDVPGLREIAACSHRSTRFYADPHLPNDRCDALYRTWIELECRGAADVVVVAEDAGQPVGYVSCHLQPERATGGIGLVGVAQSWRGCGVASALLTHALDWFATGPAMTVEVVTQGGNVAAQHLYQRHGFVTSSVGLWFHKWYASAGS